MTLNKKEAPKIESYEVDLPTRNEKMKPKRVNQDRHPNFRGDNGKLYLVRCFACRDPEHGKENYAMCVALSLCAWCGWQEKRLTRKA